MEDVKNAKGDLHRLTARDLAHAIASRSLSPVEVVEDVLRRAEAVGPGLNIFSEFTADAARAAARRAEAEVMSGAELGPLHGVPITVKDNVPVKGLRLANGSVAVEASMPDRDADAAGRALRAGANLIGKTNLPEFAHKVLTDSPGFGVTRNPWNLDHTPGGSSGGASAALAAGIAPIAIGTDGGGSIRCPASCTGVSGLKATLGRIPFESFPDAFGNFVFIGPMARTVGDLHLLFSVMGGPAAGDPYSIGAPPTSMEEPDVRGLRVGWIENFGRYRTEAEVAKLTSAAVSTLATTGAHVEVLDDRCFDNVFRTYVVIASTAHTTRYGPIAARNGDAMSPSLRESIEKGAKYTAVDLQRAADERTTLFRSVQRLFERFDLIATPTMTAPPPLVDAGGSVASEMYAEWAAPLYPFNITGHPAASFPAGFTASGLPVGIQLIGPYFGERRILAAGAALERGNDFLASRPADYQ